MKYTTPKAVRDRSNNITRESNMKDKCKRPFSKPRKQGEVDAKAEAYLNRYRDPQMARRYDQGAMQVIKVTKWAIQ